MSSSATIGNDNELSDCVQQTSTGDRGTRRALGVNSNLPSVYGDQDAAASTPRRKRTPLTLAVEPGIHEGNASRKRQRSAPPIEPAELSTGAETRGRRRTRPLPIAAVEPGTHAGNATRTGQRRRQPTAAVEPGTGARTSQRRRQPTAAVEPGTGTENAPLTKQRTQPTVAVELGTAAENATRTRQRRTRPAAAVQPGRRGRNTTRRRTRTTSPTSDGEPSTDEDNRSPTRSRRGRVFEHDLTPAQRAIPDTGLLRDLGYHLSAYARAGRGPPTRNLNCRGAWHTAVELYREANDMYKELFVAAGFRDFLTIIPVDVPVAYNLALTERWFSETNTLHLPDCEIGPTPVDWTMITGVSFSGRRIEANSEFEIEKALDLLGKPGARKDGKIHLDKIKPKPEEVRGIPLTDDVRDKLFRRLFLYVVSSCFFSNNRSVISHNLVECLERIDEVGSYNWGEVTYAAFLAGMRRKVRAQTGAFTAFWQFLPFWAFEYLDVNRPKHKEGNIFPRASRWICPKSFSDRESPQFIGPRFINLRCQLNYVEESQVTWQPYLASAEYGSDAVQNAINLAKMRIPFQSIYTWEYYLGERCLRQLGFPCRVPNDPPRVMHGIKDGIFVGTPAESLVEENQEFTSWFGNNSIGRILDINRFLGGPDIAEKVLDQWRAKHQPDLIPIQKSQYEKLKEDRNALEEECAKLREELSQARGEESCVV
ncbi:serine/threonine-protein phosphatase 7 long form homolog [Apium graveolens]|uniref:serine/threonine-protein phosphatase 7 long form homolog n=1 Tax=Apium graveolens TaxID=4045 RepID=UPI003D7925D1